MKELYAELEKRNIKIPFRGIRDSDSEKLAEDIAWLPCKLTREQLPRLIVTRFF